MYTYDNMSNIQENTCELPFNEIAFNIKSAKTKNVKLSSKRKKREKTTLINPSLYY